MGCVWGVMQPRSGLRVLYKVDLVVKVKDGILDTFLIMYPVSHLILECKDHVSSSSI